MTCYGKRISDFEKGYSLIMPGNNYARMLYVLIACLIVMVTSNIFAHSQSAFATIMYGENGYGIGAGVIEPTNNGEYIIGGIAPNETGIAWGALIMKTGAIDGWGKIFGMTSQTYNVFNSIYQTQDGGFIAAGSAYFTTSINTDFRVAKLSYAGNVVWSKTYDSSGQDDARYIYQNTDGTYIVAGKCNVGFCVLKLNSTGDIIWERGYSTDSTAVHRTNDDGLIVAGKFNIKKIASSGNVIFARQFNLSSNGGLYDVQQTADGGYILAGAADASHSIIIKLDAAGNIIWQKSYGQGARSIRQTTDGGYVFADSATEGFQIIRINSDGNIIWQTLFTSPYVGGGDAVAVRQKGNQGYLVSGNGMYFDSAIIVLGLDNYGEISPSCTHSNSLSAVDTNYQAIDIQVATASVSFSTTVRNDYYTATVNMQSICAPILPGAVPDNGNYPGTPLMISKNGTDLLLSWGEPGGSCYTKDYGIYLGTLPWSGYNHSPIVCSTSGLKNKTIPSPADSYYYFVVAQSAGWDGSYGVDSFNNQRPVLTEMCLPQQIGSCN